MINITFQGCGSAGKEYTCDVRDLGLIPGLERSLGEGNSYPLQYYGLESSMDCIVHRVAKSWTQLSNFHFTSHFNFILFHDQEMELQTFKPFFFSS